MKRPLPIHKELFQPFWMMEQSFFENYRSIIERNRKLGLEFESDIAPEALPGFLVFSKPDEMIAEGSASFTSSYMATTYTHMYEKYNELPDDAQIINIVPVLGPVTSESSCAYPGMRSLAAQVEYADNHKNVVGHFILLDTPGGAASANELNVALSKANKPVIGLVRGMCASKGVDIANSIPTVYVERLDCILGSVGTMWNMSGVKDNTVIDGVIYRSIYADDATEKNLAYRKAIDGDDSLVKAELNQLNQGFMARTKKRWPKCTEEHLHGATFKAHELDGVFHDGVRSFSECVYELFDKAGVEPNFKGVITELGMIPEGKIANGPDTNQTSQTLTNTSEASDSAIPAEASAQEELRNTQEAEQPEAGADSPMAHGSSSPDVVENDHEGAPVANGIEGAPAAETVPAATAQNQDSINNQNQTRMKDFYEKIPGVGVVATNEDGSLALTVAQNQVIATYMAAQSATIAQLQQDAVAKEKEIEELADRTEVPSAQAVPQNNNAGEQTAQGVDGPIANTKNFSQDMEILRKQAAAFGLERNPRW